jgi:serine acetyltransferase
MVTAIKADYATQVDFDARYQGRPGETPSPVADMIKRVGLQVTAAYRVMRFFHEAGIPVAPQVASRLIRHAYGSDIHWKAEIDPGVMVVHGMGMAISPAARIGANVLIFQNVTLGSGVHPDTREVGAPTIEHDVHIGPGAVIIGPVTIGARSKIMANCVVMRSVPPDSLVEAPAMNVRPRNVGRSAAANEDDRRSAAANQDDRRSAAANEDLPQAKPTKAKPARAPGRAR